MSKFFRCAVLRVSGLFAIFAWALSCAPAEACDRPHYSRPLMRPIQSRIPPQTKSPSAATPAMKARVDPETGQLTDKSPTPSSEGEERTDGSGEAPAARPAASEPAQGGGAKAKVGRERYPY